LDRPDRGTGATFAGEQLNSKFTPGVKDAKMNTCSNCRFWNRQSLTNGECRRRSPEAALIPVANKLTGEQAMARQSYWPPTHGDGWCGEFEPAKGDKTATIALRS
jgi:hypothetical protein